MILLCFGYALAMHAIHASSTQIVASPKWLGVENSRFGLWFDYVLAMHGLCMRYMLPVHKFDDGVSGDPRDREIEDVSQSGDPRDREI